MNWFQKFFSNPNVHAIGAALASAATIFFPQYALPLAAVGSLLGVTAAAIPENPVLVPVPVHNPASIVLPTVAPGTSYHSAQYAELFTALIQALKDAGIVATPPAK